MELLLRALWYNVIWVEKVLLGLDKEGRMHADKFADSADFLSFQEKSGPLV